MHEKHKRLLNELNSKLKDDPRYLGLIICGSLATGKSRENSDVDLCLVATDEEYNKIKARKDYYFGNTGPFAEEEIEIDGKIINRQFLVDAAVKGNEPTRESFRDAFLLFDHCGDLDSLIGRILVYPEKERDSKLRRFYSLLECNKYYADQAMEQKNDYLISRCITECVFYASRFLLTYNRLFFPCHKSMFHTLEKARIKPRDFIAKSKELLEHPTEDKLEEYFNRICEYSKELDMTLQESVGLILEDEWTWFTGQVPVGLL